MSGTSLDGVDAALLETDGEGFFRAGPALTVPYPDALRDGLRSVLGGQGPVADIERTITLFHAKVAKQLCADAGDPAIDLVGFHGHTILHQPDQQRTWQIGDGALLADLLGLPVINDFRSLDVAEGGEGAPLLPAFHRALASRLGRPLAILNIGGVANVTWIGADGSLLAFDTGPGNALIDDWVFRHQGARFDPDGALARQGTPQEDRIAAFLSAAFFSRPPPKSLDRDDFRHRAESLLEDLSPADGAATLVAFTARAAAAARGWFPEPAARWLICGGGRHNGALMAELARVLKTRVEPVEEQGWQGDAIEAQGFAYLAVRSLRGLPLSWPETTGVRQPMTGGRLHRPPGSGL